jgi:hypothetical protein
VKAHQTGAAVEIRRTVASGLPKKHYKHLRTLQVFGPLA